MTELLYLNFILPLIASFAGLIQHRPTSKMISIIASFLLVINNILILLNHNKETLVLADFMGNYQLALTIEPLAIFFALMVSILYFCTNLYSFAFLADQERSNLLGQDLHPKLHFFFTPIAIMASLNIGYSANLMTLFIFYEILTLSTYPLVIQSFTDHAQKSGRTYIGILFGASAFFLPLALIFMDYKYGGSSFVSGGTFTENHEIKDFLFLLICFVFGFSKTAIFPLHHWLPRAMVAPVPVSALLHAVAVVKSGIFALMKVFVYLFGIDYLAYVHDISPWTIDWLTLLACFTILYAGIMACLQESLKKTLAYSTIAQLSYMILALSFTSYLSFNAAFLQMLAHSIAKITLFFSVGIIYTSLHKVDINDVKGIFRILPIPVLLFIAASLSIVGLPASVGYLTVNNLYNAIPCNGIIGSIAISSLLISSLLACFYFARIIFQMLTPNVELEPLYYNPRSLSLITGFTFAFSALLAYYLNDINYVLNYAWNLVS
jgi:multicomponent Na+:H+ antiporter subunit D